VSKFTAIQRQGKALSPEARLRAKSDKLMERWSSISL
jgi:hypothetical protein